MVTTLWIQTAFNHIKIVSHISNQNSAWILQKVVYIEFENVFRHFPQKKGVLNRRFFCRTFMEHFNFYTNLKFNWENWIFHLCPNVAIFLKMYLFSRIGHFKKNNIERTRISMWFGRENDENVVRFGLEIDVVGLPPLVQPFWRLLDTNKQTPKQTSQIYI